LKPLKAIETFTWKKRFDAAEYKELPSDLRRYCFTVLTFGLTNGRQVHYVSQVNAERSKKNRLNVEISGSKLPTLNSIQSRPMKLWIGKARNCK